MKRIILLIFVFTNLLLIGCWDMQEINEIIFPYTIGVDANEEKKDEAKYNISFTYPNINAFGRNAKSDTRTYLISQKAKNIFDATHMITTRNYEPIDLKHVKVLALSEDVAKDKEIIIESIDALNRDFIINKMVELLIVEDNVEKFLEVKTKSERQETTEGAIYSILKHKQESTRFTPKSLNNFIEDMDTCRASLVPLGKIDGDEIIIEGGALFKNYKMVGKINSHDNQRIAMLNSDVKIDGLNIDYKGKQLVLEVIKVKTKPKLEIQGDNFRMTFNVKITSQIHEYIIGDGDKVDSSKTLEDMGKTMSEKIEKDINKTIKKLQKEFNVDIIGIYKNLNRFHPKVWKEVKDDWDEIFLNIDIRTNVDVIVRRRGLTN